MKLGWGHLVRSRETDQPKTPSCSKPPSPVEVVCPWRLPLLENPLTPLPRGDALKRDSYSQDPAQLPPVATSHVTKVKAQHAPVGQEHTMLTHLENEQAFSNIHQKHGKHM